MKAFLFFAALALVCSAGVKAQTGYGQSGDSATHLRIGLPTTGTTIKTFYINQTAYPVNSVFMSVSIKDSTTVGFYLVAGGSAYGPTEIVKPRSYKRYIKDSGTAAAFANLAALYNFYRWHMIN